MGARVPKATRNGWGRSIKWGRLSVEQFPDNSVVCHARGRQMPGRLRQRLNTRRRQQLPFRLGLVLHGGEPLLAGCEELIRYRTPTHRFLAAARHVGQAVA